MREGDGSASALIKLLIGACLAMTLVVAVAVIGLLRTDSQRLGRQRSLAHAACWSAMESVRGLPVEAIPDLQGRGFDVPGIDGQPNGLPLPPDDADGLAGRIEVTVEDRQGAHVIYRVTMTVTWGTQRNRHEHALSGLVAARAGT